jgi:transcriptional regulator with XRE-family HTH domain
MSILNYHFLGNKIVSTSEVVEKLKEYMAENNLSAKQLAGKLGWTPGDLGAILGGHKTIGKNRLLHKLSASLSRLRKFS